MRFNLHLRRALGEQIQNLAQSMTTWDAHARVDEAERNSIAEHLKAYPHTTKLEGTVIWGVDGSGDFPMLTYADSFVYLAVGQAVRYRAMGIKLLELAPEPLPVIDVCWLPEHEQKRKEQLDLSFANLAGQPLEEIVSQSDYRDLKAGLIGKKQSVAESVADLIRPHASDSGNLGIQLRSCAELGAALRAVNESQEGDIVLLDGTLALPFAHRAKGALFHEHLKRACCVAARQRSVTLAWISKSHGLPGIELIEQIARDQGMTDHWYLRLPRAGDRWSLSLADGRSLPPYGAVSYLWRTHRGMPVFRVDLDAVWWEGRLGSLDATAREAAEQQLFGTLDFAGHDYRTRAYPYPLKAAHDRASLTDQERLALRKQMVEAAVASGMKPSAFMDASRMTGHG